MQPSVEELKRVLAAVESSGRGTVPVEERVSHLGLRIGAPKITKTITCLGGLGFRLFPLVLFQGSHDSCIDPNWLLPCIAPYQLGHFTMESWGSFEAWRKPVLIKAM